MNTPLNTRLACAFAAACTTLSLLAGLAALASSSDEPARQEMQAKRPAPAANAVVVASMQR